MRNEYYWREKEERESRALVHTKYMDTKYSEEIKNCISNTRMYRGNDINIINSVGSTNDITIEPLDTVSAIIKYKDYDNLAALNFSSYKNPGGMFLKGSKAQEECLCHSSFLYNVLREFQTHFYDKNCNDKNRAMYRDNALFSPHIIFEKDIKVAQSAIITCAAPNKFAGQKYAGVTDSENYKVLKNRIKFVLDVAADNEVKTLILGAYGCGVFGQDPNEVSCLFKEYLNNYAFDKVVFAIPIGNNRNFESFRKVFDC